MSSRNGSRALRKGCGDIDGADVDVRVAVVAVEIPMSELATSRVLVVGRIDAC
jgi:hypothetical protein